MKQEAADIFIALECELDYVHSHYLDPWGRATQQDCCEVQHDSRRSAVFISAKVEVKMSQFPPEGAGESGLGSLSEQSHSLGSLKQQARGSNLKSARWALGLACVIMFIQAAVEYYTSEMQIDAAFDREIKRMGPGVIVNQAKLKEAKASAMKIATMICLGIAGMGVLFLILTLFVYRYPLFCTVGGLILYIGVTLIMAYFIVQGHEGADIFAQLWKGILWKVIIIVGLLKGIQAALAFQRERAELAKEQAGAGEVMPLV